MRIAIVDDLAAERTLMKERLVRQLGLRGAQAEILEFDSGEAFLAARQKQRFTAAFLDIYMPGRSGMDVARELRKKDADCILVFTTTSTDHALEGFQVRALHYLGSSRFRKTSSPDCWTKCLKGCRSRKNFWTSRSVEVISVCAVVTLCMLSILPI